MHSFIEAIEQQQAGNFPAAIAICQNIIAEHPQHIDALHLLGLLLSQTGQLTEAQQYLHQACELAPEQAVIHNHLANVLLKQGQLIQASDHYHAAILLNPDYIAAQHNLGLIALQQQDSISAIKYFQRVVELDPQAENAQFQLATLYLQQDEIDAAITTYQQVLALNPQHLEAYNNLGAAYLKQANYLEAIKHFATVLRINNDHIAARNNLAAILLQQDRYAEAVWQYQQLMKLTPEDMEVYYNLGVAQLMCGEVIEALDNFQTVLKQHPNHINARINLAAALHKLNRKTEAADEYTKILQQQPDNIAVKYLLDAISGRQVPTQAPPVYVQQLFDNYAGYFDRHVQDTLQYQVPELLRKEIAHIANTTHATWQILDLGCGTGLAGIALQSYAQQLIGIDISEKMIKIARSKAIYSELLVGDLLPTLHTINQSFDLIIAADVFVYFGELMDLFAAVQKHLKPNAYFAFSVEAYSGAASYHLTDSGRYVHHEKYLQDLALQNNFEIVVNKKATTRLQEQQPVTGMLIILKNIL